MGTWSEARILKLIQEEMAEVTAPGASGMLDDGASLPLVPAGHVRVISCDAQQENTDFDLALCTSDSAGHRAIVQNVSDLAAMGAKPVGFVWSLELPPHWLEHDARLLRDYCKGAQKQCLRDGLLLLGGDLSLGAQRFSCTITVLGDAQTRPLNRRGAKPGDKLYVSRGLGASAKGLQLLQAGIQTDPCITQHLYPSHELELGQQLIGIATSCMDISDGFSRDLHRLCKASGVGAHISHPELLISPLIKKEADAQALAFFSGEEYALLFTARTESEVPALCVGVISNRAGQITHEKNGETRPLEDKGYDHFSSACGQTPL